MRLLLLNNNPAVSRLIKLSVDKVGYEMDEFDDYGLVPLKSYDVIMVDNELYDEAELMALSEQVHCEYFLYICQRGSEKPSLVNVSLEKPFLPTDFLTLLEKVKNVVDSFKAEEPKEEPMADENNDVEEMQAFDIDKIDTFGIDEEDELGLLENGENDFIDQDEKEDDELSLTLDLEEDDDLDVLGVNKGLADFDFAEEEEHVMQDKEEVEENKETDNFEEISASILDRDDINEVKQLLDDNENEDKDEKDEDFDFSFGEASETLMEEEEEDKELSFDEDLAVEEAEEEDEEDLEKDVALELEEITFDEPVEIEDEAAQVIEEELPSLETQEEIIDDFAEEIEEKIEEEVEAAAEEESVQPIVALELAGMDSLDVESLDDLNENLLKKAFGEEIEEDVEEEKPIENVHEIEVMRGEIESSIARSISGFAQSDILREALKGMKINISITFDEKN